jgi:hypothetical protein
MVRVEDDTGCVRFDIGPIEADTSRAEVHAADIGVNTRRVGLDYGRD